MDRRDLAWQVGEGKVLEQAATNKPFEMHFKCSRYSQ